MYLFDLMHFLTHHDVDNNNDLDRQHINVYDCDDGINCKSVCLFFKAGICFLFFHFLQTVLHLIFREHSSSKSMFHCFWLSLGLQPGFSNNDKMLESRARQEVND